MLLANCAPLSFLDVDSTDYAMAMLGVYEKQDISIAVDLFDWTYRRSIGKYRVVLESMGAPDPFRSQYREQLGDAVRQIVGEGLSFARAVESLGLPAQDRPAFEAMARAELAGLETYNCARYRVSFGRVEEWIAKGRPA